MSLDWFSVQIAQVLSSAFLELPAEVQAAWLRSHALAAQTDGIIQGIAQWSRRMLDRSAGLTPKLIERLVQAGLANWTGAGNADLSIIGYDFSTPERVRARSEAGRKAAYAMHQARANALRSQEQPQSEGTASAEPAQCATHAQDKTGHDKTEKRASAPNRPARTKPSAQALDLAEYLGEAINSHSPRYQVTPERWATDIDLALRIDGRSAEDLRRVIDFGHRSPDVFWRSILLSGRSLRKQTGPLLIKVNHQAKQGRHDVRSGAFRPTGDEVYQSGEIDLEDHK